MPFSVVGIRKTLRSRRCYLLPAGWVCTVISCMYHSLCLGGGEVASQTDLHLSDICCGKRKRFEVIRGALSTSQNKAFL